MIRLLTVCLLLQTLGVFYCVPAFAVLPKHGVYHQGRLEECARRSVHVRRKSRHHRLAHRLKHLIGRRASHAMRSAHYAYPSGFFMWSAPEEAEKPLSDSEAQSAKEMFRQGDADQYSPAQLVQAGAFIEDPLRGGIFNRREEVKNIIMHSTETARPADAQRVITSWNRGMRHPGAQYIVDRDGTIYQTVDPKYGTVHVDVFRTLGGINNDNSIGIEMVRSGEQQYTKPQLDSVEHLVVYLQNRFAVPDDHIFGHGQIQPSDRTDPVDFDWTAFQAAKSSLRSQALAYQHHTHSAIVPDTAPELVPEHSAPAFAPAAEHVRSFIESECGVP